VNNGGNDASSEGAGIQVARTGTAGSIMYANAAASKWKVGALGLRSRLRHIDRADLHEQTWHGVAVGDSYIASSANWNTAYTHSQDTSGAGSRSHSRRDGNMIVRRDSPGPRR